MRAVLTARVHSACADRAYCIPFYSRGITKRRNKCGKPCTEFSSFIMDEEHAPARKRTWRAAVLAVAMTALVATACVLLSGRDGASSLVESSEDLVRAPARSPCLFLVRPHWRVCLRAESRRGCEL